MPYFHRAIAICLLLVFSCTEVELGNSSPIAEKNSQNIVITPGKVNEVFNLDSVVQGVRYLQLESSEKALFGNVGKISFSNDSMFIVEDFSNDLAILFDQNGKLIEKIGAKGQGPGEYLNIGDIQFNDQRKTIDLLSNVPRRISRFSKETGQYLDEIDLPHGSYIVNFSPYGKDYLISNSLFDLGNEDFSYHFLLLDGQNGKVKKRFAPFEEFERKNQQSIYRLKKAFSSQRNSLSAYYWGSTSMYSFEGDSCFQKFHFDFKEHPFVTDRLLDSKGRDELKMASEEVCCLNPIYELEDHIFGSYYFGEGFGEHFLYSKNSQKLVQFSDESIMNPFNGMYFRAHQGSIGKELVIATYPKPLLNSYNKNKQNLLSQEAEKLKNFLSQVDMEGNPVLIFYTLKEF